MFGHLFQCPPRRRGFFRITPGGTWTAVGGTRNVLPTAKTALFELGGQIFIPPTALGLKISLLGSPTILPNFVCGKMETPAIMEDLFFVTLYGGVAMLNAAAAFYLLLRRSNAIAPEVTFPIRLRRWAAAFLMASALSHMLWILYANHPSPTGYKVFCGLDILLSFPTIAGILLAMLQDRHRPVWPVLVMLSLAVPVWVLSLVREEDALSVPLSIYVTALIVLMMLFMFFAVRRYGRWLRDNYADFLVFDKDLLTAEKEGFSYNMPSEVYFVGKKVN